MAETGPRGPYKPRPPRVSIKIAEDALRKHGGNQMAAAQALGVSRHVINKLVKKHMRLRLAILESNEELTDVAEGQFVMAVRRGEPWAVKMQLERGGQDRGFGQRKLAFKDGDGQVFVPAIVVSEPEMTPEAWIAKYGDGGNPIEPKPPTIPAAE